MREKGRKLNRQGELFDMSNAPWEEKPAIAGGVEAEAARKRLQAVLDKLNPAGEAGSAKRAKKVPRTRRQGKKKPQ